jgi:hypothetical protein
VINSYYSHLLDGSKIVDERQYMGIKQTSPEDVLKIKKNLIAEISDLVQFARKILGTEALDKTCELSKEWDENFYPTYTHEELFEKVLGKPVDGMDLKDGS